MFLVLEIATLALIVLGAAIFLAPSEESYNEVEIAF